MVPQRSMPYTLNPTLNLSIKILLVTQWIDNKNIAMNFIHVVWRFGQFIFF